MVDFLNNYKENNNSLDSYFLRIYRGKDFQTFPLRKDTLIIASKSSFYCVVQKTYDGYFKIIDDAVIVLQSLQNLVLLYGQGYKLTIEDFYLFDEDASCAIQLPSKSKSNYWLSSSSAWPIDEGQNEYLSYYYGPKESVLKLAKHYDGLIDHLTLDEAFLPTSLFSSLKSPYIAIPLTIGVLGSVALALEESDSSFVNNNALIVKGTIYAGPVLQGHGLKVMFYNEDGLLLAETPLDANGSYQISLAENYQENLLAYVVDTSSSTDYIDEATKEGKSLDVPLRAISFIDGGVKKEWTMNVTPLSELAVRYLGLSARDSSADTRLDDLALANSKEAVNEANNSIRHLFGLTNSSLTSSLVETIVNQDGTINPDANIYGKMLASISGVELNENSNLSQIFNVFVQDILDDNELSLESKQRLLRGSLLAEQSLISIGQSLGFSDDFAYQQAEQLESSFDILTKMVQGESLFVTLDSNQLNNLGINVSLNEQARQFLSHYLSSLNQSNIFTSAHLNQVASIVNRFFNANDQTVMTTEELAVLGLDTLVSTPQAILGVLNQVVEASGDRLVSKNILFIADDLVQQKPIVLNSSHLNTRTPLLFGKAQPDSVITLEIESSRFLVNVNSIGNWSLDTSTAVPDNSLPLNIMADGVYTISLSSTLVGFPTR